jgi:carboxylate-amine ligase
MEPGLDEPGGDGSDPLGLAPLPQWEHGSAVPVEEYLDVFAHATPHTIGLEEELMLLSPRTLDLYPGIEGVLATVGRDGPFRPELREAQLEIVTPVAERVDEAVAALEAARRAVIRATDGFVRIAAAGTHPSSADWGELADAERYTSIGDEYQWAARRSMACGLHVHVALGDAEIALAVHDAIRSFLPEIAALAANSPFFERCDSGLCSIRPKLNEALPRSGVPPAFGRWRDFVAFLDWGRTGGLFPDASYLWWDLRLNPRFGTVEVRVADAQTTVEDVAAIAALVHTLVVWLARRAEAGERLPVHASHLIAENAWRALRHGVRGWLVDLDTGTPTPARERIGALLRELDPVACSLGCADELACVGTLLVGNGADRQRYVAEREGLPGLVRWLADSTDPAGGRT